MQVIKDIYDNVSFEYSQVFRNRYSTFYARNINPESAKTTVQKAFWGIHLPLIRYFTFFSTDK